MNHSEISIDLIKQAMAHVFYPETRNITLHTGSYGFDLFEEEYAFQGTGLKRRYVGKKPLRILRKVHTLHKAASGRWYFLYTPNSVNG
jgi:hypothetical protein